MRPQNATAQLQAALLKVPGGAPLQLNLKESNCDDFLGHRACQLQLLVLRHATMNLALGHLHGESARLE